MFTLLTVIAALAADPDLKNDGVFAFPQKDAKVFCDTDSLRLSAWNDSEYLYIQALIPGDTDDALGLTEDGRKIGDNSDLVIDADANGEETPNLDRSYHLNPWPTLPGLRYSTLLGKGMSTGIQSDSKGRGAISFLDSGQGKKLRIDSYLIPLEELKRKPGDHVRFAFYAHSPTPELTVNSVGYTSEKRYYSHHLPWKSFHDFTLAEGHAALDIQKVPEGRTSIAVEKKPTKPMPKVGEEAPEIAAAAWLNWDGPKPPSLKSLRGKVIVVEVWATWCGPCVAGIPHLNEVYDKHAKQGLVVLSLTDQAKKDYIENFMKGTPMHYTVGIGSQAVEDYGVTGIPHAFIIGRDGKVLWSGQPSEDDFEKTILSQLDKS
jgi:thiol-disulfide isomerase/thioredoxin